MLSLRLHTFGAEGRDLLGRGRQQVGQEVAAGEILTHIPHRDQPAILAGRDRDDSLAPIGGVQGV